MFVDEIEIRKAIEQFETYNNLSISQYCHPSDVTSLSDSRDQDPYLADFYNRIINWLQICCDIDAEREFLRLLSQFNYLPSRHYRNGFSILINKILENEKKELSQILFITEAAENNCKSGGDEVRSAVGLHSRGILGNDAIRAYSKDRIPFDERIQVVVFIDDITGSGKTIYRMVNSCVEKKPWLRDKRICIACLCGRQQKIKEKTKSLRKLGLDVEGYIGIPLHKCYGNSSEDNSRKTITEKYEKCINSPENWLANDTEKECFMGFEQNQLLVSFYYNTPNNTLSVFWRKTRVSPNPLFMRFPKPRPNLSWFAKRKKSFVRFAHSAFRIFK